MSISSTLCGGTSRLSTPSGAMQLPFYLTRMVSPPAYCVSDIMTFQLPGGPSARSVPFAVVRLESRYALSPAALYRLRLAVVISAQGVPLPESPCFPFLFHPGAKYRAIQADAARYLFAVSCRMRLGSGGYWAASPFRISCRNPPSYIHVLSEPSFPRHLFPRSSMDLRHDK